MNSKTAIILGLAITAIAKVDGSRGASFLTTTIPNTLVVTLVMTGVGVLGRQERYPAVKPQTIVVKPQKPKYGRPQASYGRPVGGRPGGGGGGGDLLGNVLQGVQFNVLDAKFIGLGFVREDLVGELCTRATNQLLEEGESRAQDQVKELQDQLVDLVDQRCSELVEEADDACLGVLDQIQERFASGLGEAMEIADEQCDAAKDTTVQMVKVAAEQTYNGQADLGRQLAEAEFRRQVEEEKNRGERMFQEEVEKQRAEGEKEFRRQVEEGRVMADRNFTMLVEEGRVMAEANFTILVEEGRVEAEKQYNDTIAEQRGIAERTYQETVDRERANAEKVFLEQVAMGRADAEKQFQEAIEEGREDGEKMCTDMISLACQDVTEGTDSEDFCLDFFFFTTELDDDLRVKRGHESHLYGGFYDRRVALRRHY